MPSGKLVAGVAVLFVLVCGMLSAAMAGDMGIWKHHTLTIEKSVGEAILDIVVEELVETTLKAVMGIPPKPPKIHKIVKAAVSTSLSTTFNYYTVKQNLVFGKTMLTAGDGPYGTMHDEGRCYSPRGISRRDVWFDLP